MQNVDHRQESLTYNIVTSLPDIWVDEIFDEADHTFVFLTFSCADDACAQSSAIPTFKFLLTCMLNR
jgi:hypothetical protein